MRPVGACTWMCIRRPAATEHEPVGHGCPEGADPGWPSFRLPFLGHARKGDSRVSAKAFDVARRRRTRSVQAVDVREKRRKSTAAEQAPLYNGNGNGVRVGTRTYKSNGIAAGRRSHKISSHKINIHNSHKTKRPVI